MNRYRSSIARLVAARPWTWIDVVIYPLKSGEPGSTLVRATLEDGTVMGMFGRRA